MNPSQDFIDGTIKAHKQIDESRHFLLMSIKDDDDDITVLYAGDLTVVKTMFKEAAPEILSDMDKDLQ